MRTIIAFTTLFAAVAAQGTATLTFGNPSQTPVLNPTRAPSSIGIVEPSAVQSSAGPIQSDKACAQISDFVGNSKLQYPSVVAELALACLKSVPIMKRSALATIASLKQMMEFQSTISYLKNPPVGWPNEAVDIFAGLDDINNKVNNNNYANEYDFEVDIASLLLKAHDGHLNFNGMAYSGAVRWRRNTQIALISASKNGSETPKIWALGDFNVTNRSYDPSPVTRVNGQEVLQFLEAESMLNAYHDPDTRYNALFFMQPAENYGYFTNPRFYPGPMTSITYENGTVRNYTNSAIVLEPKAWEYISGSKSFYDTYIAPSSSSQRVKQRDPNALPLHLDNPRDHEFHSASIVQHGSVPVYYPKPFIAHSAPMVPLAGYFVNTAQGAIGVLVVQTFNTDDAAGAKEFQQVIQRYITESKSRNVTKHVIDVRTNGGGKILSGYDMFLQFFPSKKPQTQSRYRGHKASELFGKSISSIPGPTQYNMDLYTSPFSNDAYLSGNLTAFPDWNAMYPPTRFYNDSFTALLKYNLTDPLVTSNERYGVGIVPTGYGNRSNFTQDPFRAEDIMILSDGICASTCAIFLELMVQQAHVRTLAVGGRPRLGPMVPVGGTKGTLVIPSGYLQALSIYMASNFATSTAQVREWADFLPSPFSIAVQDASVNFQDNIRAGLETDGIPTQFLNDTASCRIWYEPQMYLNVTRLWEKTAAVAFGKDGGLDRDACVAGSVSSREQQTGFGEGNPMTGGGNGTAGEKKKSAAGTVRPGWFAVVVCTAMVGLSMAVM